MSDLRLLVNTRKFTRKLVTENFNKRQSFASLSAIEKASLKVKLNEYAAKLKDLDSQIQNLKWATEKDESKLDEEFSSCEDYLDKIRDCLLQVETIPVSQPNG